MVDLEEHGLQVRVLDLELHRVDALDEPVHQRLESSGQLAEDLTPLAEALGECRRDRMRVDRRRWC